MEGTGIRHLGPIRQMSPYGGAGRQYLTDTKGQRRHLGFGGELSVGKAVISVFAHAALGELGGAYSDADVGGGVK